MREAGILIDDAPCYFDLIIFCIPFSRKVAEALPAAYFIGVCVNGGEKIVARFFTIDIHIDVIALALVYKAYINCAAVVFDR